MATDNLLSANIISVVIQSGEGVPNHIAIRGTIYIDRNTGISYQNKDGIYTWEQFAYLGDLTGSTGTGNSITGGTYNPSAGTLTFINSTGGSFNVIGSSLIESNVFKQNSMTHDGSGTYYPTVDAVNIQANNLAKAVTQTGFISVNDDFTLYKYDDNTLGISGSSDGIVFKELFDTPPFTPSSAIVQLTSRLVPLSGIGLTGGSAIKFVGYRQSDDSIVFSDTQFIQSTTVCQLGIVLVKLSGGSTTFIDSTRTFINQPDISAYSNLDTTSTGVKSNVIVDRFDNDLRIKNTAGNLIGVSVNWHGTNNDLLSISAQTTTGSTFLYLYPGLFTSTSALTTTSLIDPTRYWNGSALTQVGTVSGATIQRFLINVRGNLSVQYSDFAYSSFTYAQSNVWVQQFTDVLPFGTFAEIGRLVITSGCTNLNDITTASFYSFIGGNSTGGSTSSTPTLFEQDIVVSLSGGKTMGKYLNGQTIPASGKTFEQVLRDIAIEYLTPTFGSFSISGQATLIEVGSILSGFKTFIWTFNNVGNVSSNTMSVIDVTNGNTAIGTSLLITSPVVLNIGTITNTSPIAQSWKGTAIATNSTTITSSLFTVNSIYPVFYGVSISAPTANQALINSGTKSVVTSTGTVSITFGASLQYLWFAIPQSSTDKTKWFVDALNNGNIGTGSDLFNNDTIVSIDSPTALWTGVNYRIYISNYATTTSGVMQLQN